MSNRGPVVRALTGLGLVGGLILALAGGIVVHGPALCFVLAAAGVAAGAAFGARDGLAASVDAAWKAAVGTVAVIFLFAGVVVLAGGGVAFLVSGLAVVAVGAVWLLRARRSRQPGPAPGRGDPGRGNGAGTPVLPTAWSDLAESPVALLPTGLLCGEWLGTTTLVAGGLEPAAQQVIVRRRQEILDELERRDPPGFARWLAAGVGVVSDPATFVRDGRTTGTDAA